MQAFSSGKSGPVNTQCNKPNMVESPNTSGVSEDCVKRELFGKN